MAAYKTLKGQSIRQVSSDPTNPQIGEIWYNTVVGSLRGYINSGAAFSSGGSMLLASRGIAGTGTKTATLGFGGNATPGGITAKTQEYGGLSWSEGGNMGTGRAYLAGFGTQTAGVAAGGYVSAPNRFLNATEEYNGSSWTSGGNMGTGRDILSGTGTETAGLIFGGFTPGNTGKTEKYDGSSWSETGDLSTGRRGAGRAGTQTAALAFGGDGPSGSPSLLSSMEVFGGTSWTSGPALVYAVEGMGSGGTSTSAVSIGGNKSGITADTLQYDGTSWTTASGSLAIARADMGSGCSSNTSGVVFGGYSPGTTTATEEFSDPLNQVKTITTS